MSYFQLPVSFMAIICDRFLTDFYHLIFSSFLEEKELEMFNICTGVCVCVCVCCVLCVCRGYRLTFNIFFCCSPPLIWRQDLSLNLKLTVLAKPIDQKVPSIHQCLPLPCWVTSLWHRAWVLCRCWGCELRCFWFHRKHSDPVGHLPRPQFRLLFIGFFSLSRSVSND